MCGFFIYVCVRMRVFWFVGLVSGVFFFLPGGVASITSAGQGLQPTFAVKFWICLQKTKHTEFTAQ